MTLSRMIRKEKKGEGSKGIALTVGGVSTDDGEWALGICRQDNGMSIHVSFITSPTMCSLLADPLLETPFTFFNKCPSPS